MVRRLRDVDALKRILLSPAQAMMLQFVTAREDAETDCSKLVSEKSFKNLNFSRSQKGFESLINKRLVKVLL
jgi:hypothetical protein